MKYIALLGRLPKLSLAELESQFTGVKMAEGRGGGLETPPVAEFESETVPEIGRLGGVLKLAERLGKFPEALGFLEGLPEGKITLGVSDLRPGASGFKAQGEALKLKKILQRRGRSVRVLSNKTAVLSTATSHHNQLAEKPNHVEILITKDGYYKLTGVQNITEYAKRDQARPARDAKVGMLPPKLAQILINLCGPLPENAILLDPFCGTGVVLQEAFIMGYTPYGTDLEPRMVEYSKKNMKWLVERLSKIDVKYFFDESYIAEGDATSYCWNRSFDAVACEAFLGQPMSQPPAEIKLKQEKERCKAIILGFLKNLSGQARTGTPVVVAVPAWLRENGKYSRLNILDEVEKLGYNVVKFRNSRQDDLLYYREGQIVAREIIVLRKK